MSNKNTNPPPSPRYLTILCEFMAYFHEKDKPYPKDHEFTVDDLAAITPCDICKWMNVKAFGTATPGMDAKLVGSGSSSLEFAKKAISFYMPIKGSYDHERKSGNPTRSRQVKELLQKVANMGGKTKRENSTSNGTISLRQQQQHSPPILSMAAGVHVDGGGRHGLLQRVHAQNSEFVNILNTMGSVLHTFGQSLDQIKSALETSNIAIRHELANVAEKEKEDDDDDTPADDAEVIRGGERIDFSTLDAEMKNHIAQVTKSLQDFMNTNIVTNTRILSGSDGFCSFGSTDSGKQLDIPDGFTLPSVELITAWQYWLTGFPNFKVTKDNGEIIDAPIRPLRFVGIGNIPQSLKKNFKDGWRPILLSMTADVKQLLDSTPITEINDAFIVDSYNTALKALHQKAPGIFDSSDGGTGKYSTWKVATWSRKIREHQLGQQQVVSRRAIANDMNDKGKEEMIDEELIPKVVPTALFSQTTQSVVEEISANE
jgi:hypothetical protein